MSDPNFNSAYLREKAEGPYLRSAPRIVCAANRYTVSFGRHLVIPSARHFDRLMHALIHAISAGLVAREHEQGFIDQHGTFYSRKDAWKIAEANGQIIRRFGCDGVLYSENLY